MLTEDDVHALLPELEAFHARFGQFFPRSESRAWSRKYLTGLLLPIERKNVENLAEQVGGHSRRLQEFVSESPWDDEGCIEEVQRLVGEQLGTGEGVLVLDDTGFPKKGRSSAGVASHKGMTDYRWSLGCRRKPKSRSWSAQAPRARLRQPCPRLQWWSRIG